MDGMMEVITGRERRRRWSLADYAAHRTMPNGSGMTHGYRGAVGCRVAVGSVPFGIA
jgi:hypothetical protein